MTSTTITERNNINQPIPRRRNGKTGRRVHRGLKLSVFLRAALRARLDPFDWTQPDNWQQRSSTRAAYLTHPDLSLARAEDDIRHFASSPRRQDQHIVLLSAAANKAQTKRSADAKCDRLERSTRQLVRPKLQRKLLADGVLAGEVVLPICDAWNLHRHR